MGKLFLDLNAEEEKRLKWLIGFFVGTHIVAPTFKNRSEWSKEKIIEELQGKLFDAVSEKFINWMQKRNDNPSNQRDELIFKKIIESDLLKTEVKALIFVKIPVLAKISDDERNGLTTRRLLKEQVTAEQWKSTLDMFGNQCSYCGGFEDITKDHIVPISKGGRHTVSNLIPACKSCNSSKSNHPLNEWYPKQEFFSQELYEKIKRHLGSEVN